MQLDSEPLRRNREPHLLAQMGGQTVSLICERCGRRLDVLHIQDRTFYSVLSARQSRWGTVSKPGFERDVRPPHASEPQCVWGCHPRRCPERRYTRSSQRVYDVCVDVLARGRDTVVLGVDL